MVSLRYMPGSEVAESYGDSTFSLRYMPGSEVAGSYGDSVFSLRCMPGIEVAESYGDSAFSLLRNCRTAFHSGCVIFHFQQQRVMVLVSPHPHQHLLLPFIAFIFHRGHPSRWEVVYHCGFDYFRVLRVLYIFLSFFLRQGLTLSPRLECNGMIITHWSLDLLGSRDPCTSAS